MLPIDSNGCETYLGCRAAPASSPSRRPPFFLPSGVLPPSGFVDIREARAQLPKKRRTMHLKDLKKKTPAELVAMAEEMGVEGASTMRKQDLMFSILKIQAENGVEIMGSGTIEVLNDGFGFLRSPESNY